jgi:c-di-GMP-binding flagellar brake protein YcgR
MSFKIPLNLVKIFPWIWETLDRVTPNIPAISLRVNSSFNKIQRREHVRIPVAIPILYKEFKWNKGSLSDYTRSMEDEISSDTWEKGMALDLSGGGMNIGIDKPLEENKHILMQLDTEGLQLCLTGQIVRGYSEIVSNKVAYRIGVSFIDISETDRDRIIGFVFKKQRDMRQKDVL